MKSWLEALEPPPVGRLTGGIVGMVFGGEGFWVEWVVAALWKQRALKEFCVTIAHVSALSMQFLHMATQSQTDLEVCSLQLTVFAQSKSEGYRIVWEGTKVVGSGYSVPGGGGRCRKEIMLDCEMSILTPSQSKHTDNPKPLVLWVGCYFCVWGWLLSCCVV